MPNIELFGNQFKMLEYSMNIRSKIHDVIASNIANVNTPGYKCKSLDFQREFNKILKKENLIDLETTDKKHIPLSDKKSENTEIESETCSNNVYGNDKNNVDIDREMAKLSKNQLLYNIDSQILVKEFKMLKDAIVQGGR